MVAAPTYSEDQGSSAPRVAVIILNRNSGDHLANCLRSILPTVRAGTRVVVLDNASTDSSLERAVLKFPQISVYRYQSNIGFAAAYNRAIRSMTEDYLILLNPDTIVDSPAWVEKLRAVAEGDPSIGAVACKLVFAENPSVINSAGCMAYWWTGPVDAGFGEVDGSKYGADYEPFSASGGAMLLRRQAFLAIGGFDERMFAYVEDLDLCWRMRLMGLRIGYAPDVIVRHAFSVSAGRLSSFKVYHTHCNYLRAMLRNFSIGTLIVGIPVYALWTALKVYGALVSEHSRRLASAPLHAIASNATMLRDTLSERRRIQRTRVVNDREIIRRMGPWGIEPPRVLKQRWTIAKRGVR